MGSFSVSEKLLIEEISTAAQKIKTLSRGLSIGAMIKLIRTQLGMSQKVLAKRAHVPQSTISRLEKGQTEPSLSTIHKVLQAVSCDYIISPILKEPVDTIRKKQARKIAEKHIRYLKGTMSLEAQKPDAKLLEELIKQEEELLLLGESKLWEED